MDTEVIVQLLRVDDGDGGPFAAAEVSELQNGVVSENAFENQAVSWILSSWKHTSNSLST